MTSWQAKQELIRKKFSLGERKFYIGHELTYKEKEMLCKIREIARRNRNNGKLVRVDYKKNLHGSGKVQMEMKSFRRKAPFLSKGEGEEEKE